MSNPDFGSYYWENIDFSFLLGKTIDVVDVRNDEIDFVIGGEVYRLMHHQDCCENVWVEDIVGYISDVVDSEILEAEVVSSRGSEDETVYESMTWTFYKLGTRKGSITIRWCGASNGYYSEEVSFVKVPNK